MSARERLTSGLSRIGLTQPLPPPPPSPVSRGGAQALDPDSLAAQRADLARRFAQLQWDLGGLIYEMAIRDHFRLDVVMRNAAELQAVDAELAEAERLLRLEDAGAAGACPSCGALYARGAGFCWSCGTRLLDDVGAAA